MGIRFRGGNASIATSLKLGIIDQRPVSKERAIISDATMRETRVGDVSVYNRLYEVEVPIDQPVGQVRHQFLDTGAWVISHVSTKYLVLGILGTITCVSFRKQRVGLSLPRHHHYQ